ncbi:MAG: hypothetical protein PCFJNLEI_02244 [Verrucomicrobiae bacterium]|nr:hypothetical protein [Verrucomicrobiae bacterium]
MEDLEAAHNEVAGHGGLAHAFNDGVVESAELFAVAEEGVVGDGLGVEGADDLFLSLELFDEGGLASLGIVAGLPEGEAGFDGGIRE